MKALVSSAQLYQTLQPHGPDPTSLFCPWNSPGKNAGVRYHALLQGIFLTQEQNLGLLHCRWILYCLSHQGALQLLLLLLSHFSHVRLCTTHRWQPTRLPCPWDSPGKNTGVGCFSFSDA